jgi:hypothetical protein
MSNKMTTAEFAAALHLTPQTIRANLCYHGHLMGIRPLKLPNRRLLWDADELERPITGQTDPGRRDPTQFEQVFDHRFRRCSVNRKFSNVFVGHFFPSSPRKAKRPIRRLA